MVEYQRGSHTLHDIKYHLVWITKYRYHVLRGAVAGCDSGDLHGSRGADHPRFSGAGSRAHAGGESTEADAVDQRSIVAEAAARILGVAPSLLGSASVGSGVFLRDGGGGG